ncbi:MAG: GntR family transcriptional regulator [Marmoricola sp.]|nr:GntR family transcriptional regulator [Marmoricola sp.]
MTHDVTADHSVDPSHFRHVVGHLASGVTVVTTALDGTDFGMTASSVTSLSVDPPMMLACLNTAVPTSGAVAGAGRFVINILGQGHEDLAYQFASPRADKFHEVDVVRGPGGLPMLGSALAHLVCEVSEQVTGGTHTIFIGHVQEASATDGRPLTYFRGGFGRFEFERNDAAYELLRDLVLRRVFRARDVLTVEELTNQLDIDRASCFYALTRLASDRLVRRDPDLGYVVTTFDVRTSDETFDARLAVELGVIDLCVGRTSAAELSELRRRFDVMAAQLVGDRFVDFHAYLDANYAFHEYLVSLAHNPLLTATFSKLSIKSVMTRSFGSTPESSHEFIDAQRGILDALEASDGAAAHQASLRYCELAKRRVREILELTGGGL